MFKLDMNAIRKSANDKLLTANAANAANFANESGKTVAQISKKSPKLAGLAGLAVSRQLNCTVQGVPASAEPHGLENLRKPQFAPAANDPAQAVGLVSKVGVSALVSAEPAVSSGKVSKLVSSQTPVFTEPPEPPIDPNAWRELAAAYHHHHFKCPACIAAGRGAGYGLRCGTGAALWTSYSDTTEQPANKGRP